MLLPIQVLRENDNVIYAFHEIINLYVHAQRHTPLSHTTSQVHQCVYNVGATLILYVHTSVRGYTHKVLCGAALGSEPRCPCKHYNQESLVLALPQWRCTAVEISMEAGLLAYAVYTHSHLYILSIITYILGTHKHTHCPAIS